MALETRLVSIPFVKGPETKVDSKLVTQDRLLSLTNASFAANGSLSRRNAWVNITGSTLATPPQGVFPYEDELMSVSRLQLHSYSTLRATQRNIGNISPCWVDKKSISRANRWADQVDCAIVNPGAATTYSCFVWRESRVTSATAYTVQGVYAVIRDDTSGTIVYGPQLLESGVNVRLPRVAAVTLVSPSNAAAFLVVWGNGTDLKGCALQPSGPSVTVVTLRTDFAADYPMDLVSSFGNNATLPQGSALLAYATTNATNSVHACMLKNVSGTISVTSGPISCGLQATVPAADMVGISIAGFSAAAYGVYALAEAGANQGVWCGTFTATATVITAGTALARKDATAAPDVATPSSITAVLSGTTMMVYSDNAGNLGGGGAAGAIDPIRALGIDSTNTVTVAASTVNISLTHATGPCGPYIAGKAFVADSVVYLPVYMGSVVQGVDKNFQNSWFLITPGVGTGYAAPVAKAVYGSFGLWTVNGAPPYMAAPPSSMPINGSATQWACPVLERGQLSLDDGTGTNVTPVGVSRINLDFRPKFSSARVGKCQFIAGGVLNQYDGQQVVEANFHLFPEGIETTLVGAGALTGTYSYIALYEWVDAQGQRHQSAPSPPVSVSPVAQNVSLLVPSLGLTAKALSTYNVIGIVLYRTANGGTTYNRLNTIISPIANDPSAAMTTAYVDSASDSSINGNEILYSPPDGTGALENLGPGPCKYVMNHQDRLWMAGLEDPSQFLFSQERVATQGLGFSPILGGNAPGEIGPLSALGTMDDKAILYTETRKAVVLGAGPNESGLQGTYSSPQLLPSDVGCIEPRSVVTIPTGQMYQSKRGIYLLNRALQDEFIGEPVEDIIEYYIGNSTEGVISSAVVLEAEAQVRFTFYDPAGYEGHYLAYDTVMEQWSHHSCVLASSAFSGACVWNGVWVFANYSNLTLGKEFLNTFNLPSFLDYGLYPITVVLATAWIRVGALSGFQRAKRVLLLGASSGETNITLDVYNDYYESPIVSVPVDSTTISASTTLHLGLQVRHHLKVQKCEALRFTITDTPVGANTYAGTNFSGITLEIGMKKGAAKLPASAST